MTFSIQQRHAKGYAVGYAFVVRCGCGQQLRYRYMVGMAEESTLTESGRPSGVCGAHLLTADSLRDSGARLPPPSAPFPCISARLMPANRRLRLTASYLPRNVDICKLNSYTATGKFLKSAVYH
ncbi:hypothetical protein EVAR_101155_1 [Eumeta japonica]|uniref:Uncharacterized protein n=1 Tax=Eumeta variegata TaxID=151549 RepID=A0A4C2A9G8_EUMVA|nr:hypothetical protein EVAR_101155_1 [Eumeta japonica]